MMDSVEKRKITIQTNKTFLILISSVGDAGSKIIKGTGKGVGQIIGGGKIFN